MHGLIHIVLKDFVLATFGQSAWESILKELGVSDDEAILEPKVYSDASTIAAVTAAARVLGITLDDALRAFGGHFVGYVHAGNHLRMLESMGEDLKEFLRNLNHMHALLERTMRNTRFPSFHLSDEGESQFKLSYASARGSTLAALVEGIIPVLAHVLHGQTVTMTRQERRRGYDVTWQVEVGEAPAKSPDLPQHERVADQKGAAKWGSLWHSAVMSCFRPQVQRAPSRDVIAAIPREESEEEVQVRYTRSIGERNVLARLASFARKVESPADILMRAVPCRHVCSAWDDAAGLRRMRGFWGTNAEDTRYFDWAEPAGRAMRFVSHSWFPPENWRQLMGAKCNYAEMKGTELQLAAAEIAEMEGLNWQEMTLWIDKCCIPQAHSLMSVCISLIEEFMERCDGMVVVLTWQYFERLWCVYEWAAFLVCHQPEDITICMEVFLRPSTRRLYIESIRNMTVDSCKCAIERDRLTLKRKVLQYYHSEQSFELFARYTAIAVIARTLCKSTSRCQAAWEEDFMPFVELAKELEYHDLAEALVSAEPARWRKEALEEAGLDSCGEAEESQNWRPALQRRIDNWFADKVVPVLSSIKSASVREEFICENEDGEISREASTSSTAASEIVADISTGMAATSSDVHLFLDMADMPQAHRVSILSAASSLDARLILEGMEMPTVHKVSTSVAASSYDMPLGCDAYGVCEGDNCVIGI